MKHGMAAETDQEPPAMGNLATSGICSLAFIHYQRLVPTLITVSPHNINNCCFFSQNICNNTGKSRTGQDLLDNK